MTEKGRQELRATQNLWAVLGSYSVPSFGCGNLLLYSSNITAGKMGNLEHTGSG